MQGLDALPGLGQRQALDERDRRCSCPTPPCVDSRLRVEGGDATGAVELVPALQGPGADPGGAGKGRERDLVFDMQPKNAPPLEPVHTLTYIAALSRAAFD